MLLGIYILKIVNYMWEYMKKDEKFQTNIDLVKFLNKLGEDNWEVVSYQEQKPENYGRHFSTQILFKRQKELPAVI